MQKEKKKRGRTRGSFIVGIKKGREKEDSVLIKEWAEGIIVSKIKGEKEEKNLVITSVYNRNGGK